VDGEAVACGDGGIASFALLRHHRRDDRVSCGLSTLYSLGPSRLRERRSPLARGSMRRAHATDIRPFCVGDHSVHSLPTTADEQLISNRSAYDRAATEFRSVS
jgi:hypothetical protein